MRNDIRVYNYYDDEPLITRNSQIESYLDKKFDNIHAKVDISEISEKIDDSTSLIIDTIEESKPCLCHLATKEDVCAAKCAVIKKIESSKEEIIKDIDEKFVDLNEIIKKGE